MEIDNLKIEQSLPLISFEYESLRQWAISITDKYRDLVVTENDIKSIKKEMAELNKAKDKLNRARIDTVKAVSAPIREFEDQIKDICGLFDETYDGLARQVKGFENREREDKRKNVETLIYNSIEKAISANPDLKDKIAVSVKDRWLNKTVSFSVIQEEIDAAIAEQIRVEREIQQIGQREAERRLLVEQTVKQFNEKYGLELPVSGFMSPCFTGLGVDAETALQRIELVFQERPQNEQISRKAAQSDLMPAKPEIEPEKTISAPSCANLITINFIIRFTPEQENQVREVLNQNQFMRIKRQLDSIGVKTTYEKVANNG